VTSDLTPDLAPPSSSPASSVNGSGNELSMDPTPTSERKVTVIELLREEYDREISVSGPSSLHGSPVHCQRAASDTDIIRRLETSSAPTTGALASQRASEALFARPRSAAGGHRQHARLSSSSSYPELSRWVEQSEQAPKLVSAVGHSTVK
jgi:hypothetical protein